MIKKLVSRGGAISHIENYDPLSPENLKRPKGPQGKTLEKLLINRTAYATLFSGSILVATNTEI